MLFRVTALVAGLSLLVACGGGNNDGDPSSNGGQGGGGGDDITGGPSSTTGAGAGAGSGGSGGVNHRPVVSAGADVTVQYPTLQIALKGTASDPDGDELALKWTQVDGAAASIDGANHLTPTINVSAQGAYTFKLDADDGNGGTASDEVKVTVGPPVSGPGVTTDRPLGSTTAPLGFVEYLPAGYSPTGNWPLMIFLHGAGEVGNGTTELDKVRANGPNHQIDVNGMQIPIVILSPQTSQGSWEEAVGNVTRVDQLITYALANYGVDPKRVYITGLSLGGGGVWAYAEAHPDRIAAAVPVCGFSGLADPTQAAKIIQANVGVWAAHALDDGTVSPKNTTNWLGAFAQNYGIDAVTDPNSLPGAPGVWSIQATTTFTIDAQNHAWKTFDGQVDKDGGGAFFLPKQFGTFYPSGGHGIWERMFGDPNVYDWLLQQSRP